MTPALLLSIPKAAKPLAIPMTVIRIAVSVRNHRSLEGNCDRFNGDSRRRSNGHAGALSQLVIYLTDMASFLTQTLSSLFFTQAGKPYHAEKPKQTTCIVEATRFFSTEPLFTRNTY